MAAYAARLKAYKSKGTCGLPEVEMSERKLEKALTELCYRIDRANGNVVVMLGAGVSTAAGVPDFRGPSGIWTKEQAARPKAGGKRVHEESAWVRGGTQAAAAALDFGSIAPTLSHHALTELERRRKIKCVVSQNIDGLEQDAGFPRDKMAVIHGCIREERCSTCGARFLRSFDVGGKSGAPTGRECEQCGGVLGATLLDWEDSWPADQAALADEACDTAALCVVLGSSLRVEPANSLPCRAKAFVLCNLQKTPKDANSRCALTVRAKCDVVMAAVMKRVCGVEFAYGEGGQVEWREL